MTSQELDSPQVLRALVDQSRLRTPHRVRAVGGRIETSRYDPVLDDPRILTGGDVRGVVQSALEEKIFRLQAGLRDPGCHCRTRRLRELELDGPLRLPLDNICAREHLDSVRHIANPQADEVTASELAVDRKVEHGEVSHLVRVLKVDADSPDVFGFERRLLANQLPLVPSLPMFAVFHDKLLAVDRSLIFKLMAKDCYRQGC